MRAIFLDRDGTIIVGVPRIDRVDSIDKIKLLPNSLEALSLLAGLNYQKFIITNQAGIAEGLITMAEFNAINSEVLERIRPSGVKISETFVCPHGENSACDCRKPKPGLIFHAAAKYNIDLANSWMIGDRLSDIQTGINAGTKTILVQTGSVIEAPEATFVAADLLEAAKFITKKM